MPTKPTASRARRRRETVEVLEDGRGVLFSYGLIDHEPDLGGANADLVERLRRTRSALRAAQQPAS